MELVTESERILMGHGLTSRTTVSLDDSVKKILEAEFQKGVTKSGNHKRVTTMVEAYIVCDFT